MAAAARELLNITSTRASYLRKRPDRYRSIDCRPRTEPLFILQGKVLDQDQLAVHEAMKFKAKVKKMIGASKREKK